MYKEVPIRIISFIVIMNIFYKFYSKNFNEPSEISLVTTGDHIMISNAHCLDITIASILSFVAF